MTVKELRAADNKLATAQSDCMTVAADHQATVEARKNELDVIAQARKLLVDTTSGAESQTYSLIQTSSALRNSVDLAQTEVITLIKKLGREYHSAALAQLASKLTAVVRYGSKRDVFSKVKTLIRDLITKLQREADADATEKAYCDEQLAKTEFKRDDLQSDIAKLTTKIDQDSAQSANLKEQVAELQSEIRQINKEQAEMDAIRREQHADYTQAKADLELGLKGVRGALTMLRDYYQKSEDAAAMLQQPARPAKFEKAAGAGDSIIGILEVCESDFATNLAKEESEEAEALRIYDKTTQENKVTLATKNQDVKYKTQEFKALDKDVSELSGDRDAANTELTAVLEYYAKIRERCIAKPETYEQRRQRRQNEIDGLKQALNILNTETASLLQRKHRSHGHGIM